MPHFISYNGKLLHEDTALVSAGNRGLRYGDGVFETMKLVNSEIILEAFHFERLFGALAMLQFKIPVYFTGDFLKEQIRSLCVKNKLVKAARIRLNIFRKSGGLYDPIDHNPEWVIEAWELHENYFRLNTNGLIVGIYNEAKKSCDPFSNLKSNNFLPYTMAALYARQKKLNDCFLLNTHERICDATIANVFWVHNETIYTPPLTEGCVAGVTRRFLLQTLPDQGYHVREKNLEISDLQQADELFLTNAVSGLRWVKEFQNKYYTNAVGAQIYQLLP
ncbi:MAG: aminotransferase class IV [Chitinophagaceae bacterium]|nr:aminotransferase class IV [Chitinophagaceae bacterium]